MVDLVRMMLKSFYKARRIKCNMVFLVGIMLSQVLLVLKKKQVEKVQAEMNF